ncbi:hypothetical protein [Silvibacterium dinghuense]|uniref:Uncharacterized protein n=1 Tax=Silvibacterium dinghuense TaxID=1560006 RepID=A0A4Q1SDT7_9BACT|nr:hypothetical protein [Silvibacterium dinghuense]RXS95402.1 hypothetical protein ESZ00_12540 [Silvibacterium dinghuense]GGH12950.1 hypothetical protein GCM10011586_32520 [Silvibacterium dinghuense]
MAGIQPERINLSSAEMVRQAAWFLLHSLFGLLAWAVMMGVVTLFHPESVPAIVTLALSFLIPLAAGFLIVRMRASNVATLTWLAGLVWFMIVGLWVLDMPTGPDACYRCGPGDKLWFTFFSLHWDSGMADGQGRFLGTWPATAMLAYSIGAKLAMREHAPEEVVPLEEDIPQLQ